MTKSVRLTWLCLVGCGIAGAAPQDPPATAPVPTADRLIARFADKNLRVRELAHQTLESMGLEALPALRKAQNHKDPEVRRRVGQLLAVQEYNAVLKPKRFTLHLRDKTAKEAVAGLAKQSGYKLEIQNFNAAPIPNGAEPEKQRVRLDLDNVTFWEAIDKLCPAAGLVYNDQTGGNGEVYLQFDDSYQPHVCRDGVLRAVAQGFQQNRGINFATMPKAGPLNGQVYDNLHFNFNISGEPRLPLLGLGTVVLTEAVDDLGNSLVPTQEENQRFGRHYWYGHYKSQVQRTGCSLSPVAREARRVKRLRGFVPVTLLMEERPDLVLEDVRSAKNKKLKSARAELDIGDVSEDKGQGNWRIKITLRNRTANADYGWYNSITQRLVLLDAKGKKYHHGGGSWSGNQNSVTADFRFSPSGNDVGPPVKLIYYDWITIQYRMKFEFRDLPLP
jgi:hypothetical protein